MVRLLLSFLLIGAASPTVAEQPIRASIQVAPQARQLFERDWVLMNWALKFYDADRNVLLSQSEAGAAAGQFRKMADANGDGRVTPQEYRVAREFILARY